MTVDDLKKLLNEIDMGIDLIAPELGVSELQPIADAANAIGQKVLKLIAQKQPNLAVEAASADIAADIDEDKKFGP